MSIDSKDLHYLAIGVYKLGMFFKVMSDFVGRFGEPSTIFKDLIQELKTKADRLKQENNQIYLKNISTWKEYCEEVYESYQISEDLFFRHCYFIIIGKSLLDQLISESSDEENQQNHSWNIINEYLKRMNAEIPGFLIEIVEWFFIDENAGMLPKIQLKRKAKKEKSWDPLGELYESLFNFDTRHKSGEYYTEYNLASAMVSDQYRLKDYCMDPACGSGIFLISICNKILKSDLLLNEKEDSIKRLYGIDMNPFAIFSAILNHLLLFQEHSIKILPNLICSDYLLTKKRLPKFNLIIGNPPWVVINGLKSAEYVEQIKDIGNRYGIIRGAKFVTSTEICTLFVYRSLEYLQDSGTVFFITPASLINGEQHALFRQFKGMSDIRIWLFEKDIFRIHSICFKAKRNNRGQNDKIDAELLGFDEKTQKFEVKNKMQYKPSYVEEKSNDISTRIVGRLIPDQKDISLAKEDSDYITLFKQGASLVPRSLVMVQIEKIENGIATIIPDPNLKSKVDGTWGISAFEKAEVEADYVFKIIKSTDMVPFSIISHNYAFLPIEVKHPKKTGKKVQSNLSLFLDGDFSQIENSPVDKMYSTAIKKPLAKKHFEKLSEIYEQYQKDNAKIMTLEHRLNYGRALTRTDQHAPLKVIYAGIGSIVKSCVLKEPYIIDTSVYYIIPDSEDEAYYLTAYLNSDIITENVQLIGSTGQSGTLRNIHKTPLKFGLKKYDPSNETHKQLADLGRQAERLVIDLIEKDKIEQNQQLSRRSIQNIILQNEELKEIIKEIDLKIKRQK